MRVGLAIRRIVLYLTFCTRIKLGKIVHASPNINFEHRGKALCNLVTIDNEFRSNRSTIVLAS